jgi:hypothetical protein
MGEHVRPKHRQIFQFGTLTAAQLGVARLDAASLRLMSLTQTSTGLDGAGKLSTSSMRDSRHRIHSHCQSRQASAPPTSCLCETVSEGEERTTPAGVALRTFACSERRWPSELE